MAKNIYDLFNEKKYGVDYLVEGVEVVDAEPYESLTEAVEALDRITMENANEMMEMKAAFYLEELVIENMMFNDFNENKIESVLEGAAKDKVKALKQKIMGWWQKIKQWFASTFAAVINHFKSGEELVRKYGDDIPAAMKSCKAKIKMNKYRDLDEAWNKAVNMTTAIKDAGQSADKEASKNAVLAAVGADDKKDVAKKVKELFVEKEKEEQTVSEIGVDQAVAYAGNKKIILDGLKKTQKDIDNDFKTILSQMKEERKDAKGEERDSLSDKVDNFQFAIGVKNTILSTSIGIVKRACSDYTAVIRKALSPKSKRHEEGEGEGEEPAAAEAPQNESFKLSGVEFDDYFGW